MAALGNVRKAEVDIGKVNLYKDRQYRDGSLGVTMPFDAPVYLRAYRLMEDTEDHDPPRMYSQGLKGWVFQMDIIDLDIKLFVRLDRSGAMKVFAEDSEGREVLGEWEAEEG